MWPLEVLKLKCVPAKDFTSNRTLTMSGFNISALDTIICATKRLVSDKITTEINLPDASYVVIVLACCYGRVEFIFGNANAVVTKKILRARIKNCHNRLNKTISGQTPGKTSIIDHKLGFAAAISGCKVIKSQQILFIVLNEITRRWTPSAEP